MALTGDSGGTEGGRYGDGDFGSLGVFGTTKLAFMTEHGADEYGPRVAGRVQTSRHEWNGRLRSAYRRASAKSEVPVNIPKHAFVAAIVALGASIVACNDPLDFDEPSTQTVEQAIASADSVGTNDSKFFPIGIYYAGSSGQGASPQDASDATQYYRETLLHLKSIGINVIINSNSYVGSAAYNLLEAATELGGIYVIQSNIAFNGVTDCWPVNTASLDLIASDSVTNLSKYPALVGYQVQDEQR